MILTSSSHFSVSHELPQWCRCEFLNSTLDICQHKLAIPAAYCWSLIVPVVFRQWFPSELMGGSVIRISALGRTCITVRLYRKANTDNISAKKKMCSCQRIFKDPLSCKSHINLCFDELPILMWKWKREQGPHCLNLSATALFIWFYRCAVMPNTLVWSKVLVCVGPCSTRRCAQWLWLCGTVWVSSFRINAFLIKHTSQGQKRKIELNFPSWP